MHNFVIRLLACFIWNKSSRQAFRRKHTQYTQVELFESLKNYIKSLMPKESIDELKFILEKSTMELREHLNTNDLHNQLLNLYHNGNSKTSINDSAYNFYKNIPAATGDLRILQKSLLLILIELDKICKKNNINYWLQAGTLLGAVRGGVFVPWDDDLDIGMLETDLNKLKQALKGHPMLRIDDYYHFVNGYVGRFTRVKYKNPKLNCFVDIPVYEYCSGTDIDTAWKEICRKRLMFEQKAEKLSKQLSKVYHNEIVTDKKDLALIKDFYTNEINSVHQTSGDFIYWAHFCVPAGWKRIFPVEMFFPLKELSFENGGVYKVPNNYHDYLSLQYGNYLLMPHDMKVKHVNDFRLFDNMQEYKKLLQTYKSGRIIGYTAGAFDVFHIGHLNLLKRAKENCDYLIVGVTTDELIQATKNKSPLATLDERMEILRQIKYVDQVVVQDDLDKVAAWERYHYDKLFSGDDWCGNPRWKKYEQELKKIGVDVIYFPYTKTISSTKIKDFIMNNAEV